MHLVAISGSLDPASANSAILRTAAALELGIDIEVWDELGDLPPFRPGTEGDEHVASLRAALGRADVVVIATPEYAGGMPGVLKNALDWVVGSGELYERRVAVVSAAPSADRGSNARRWVEQVTRMEGSIVLDSFTIAIARTADEAVYADAARQLVERVLATVEQRVVSAGAGVDPGAGGPIRCQRRLFDRIVIVDWSAAATPKTGSDSIWTYTLGDRDAVNHRTRAAASAALIDVLREPGTTLVGFDFPLGYPSGFASDARLDGAPPWSATWEHLAAAIIDDDRNRNNRWDVAAGLNRRLGELRFWGVPPSQSSTDLTVRKPPIGDEFRIVERRLKQQHLHPASTWQLLGAGSVGSQALTGIPVVHRLRNHPDLRDRARIWPFETGLTEDPTGGIADSIVLAEVWPSAIEFRHIDHPVKDAQQVIALARHYAELDADGLLSGMFAPPVDPPTTETVVAEEGWILGVV